MAETRVSLISRSPEALEALREETEARIALGRSGVALPTRAVQDFLLDHARARQAVWRPLDGDSVKHGIEASGLPVCFVASNAQDRAEYLRRPDLGRSLCEGDKAILAQQAHGSDIALVIADGLSATAVEMNAAPLVCALLPMLQQEKLSIAPVTVALQSRVALADDIGAALGARIVIVLIGERPGLSAADSLGAYITYAPETGLPDSRRNCISNIRDGGLRINDAARKIMALVLAMLQQEASGVALIEPDAPYDTALPDLSEA